MSSLTTNPARRATSAHRTQIVAEAVVSAYIHEITPTERRRNRLASARAFLTQSPRVAPLRLTSAAGQCC